MNGFSVPGIVVAGVMSDVYELPWCISVSSVGSALAVFLVWGFTAHKASLLVFACLYGLLSGGFSCLWPRWILVIARDDPHTFSTLMGVFAAGRGVGNVLSGPASAGLLAHSPLYDKTSFGYGVKGYGTLIFFTGAGLLASSIATAYRSFLPDTNTSMDA